MLIYGKPACQSGDKQPLQNGGMQTALPPLRAEPLRTACSACNLRELCLPLGLSPSDMERLDGLISTRKVIPRGESLFRASEPFHALYAVRTGFFKTCLSAEDGRVQVTGFQMAGELLGLDGIGSGHHTVDAQALEDSSVCVLPFSDVEHLRLRVAAAAQPALDVQHAAEIAQHHRVRAARGDVRALALGDVSGNLAELHRERAAETAAGFRLLHFLQLEARHFRQQRARLRLHAQFAQPGAGIVISN